MRRVSSRWKPAIAAGVNRWETVIEWSNGNGWHSVPMHSGTVTCSTEQQTRWQADLVVPSRSAHRDGVDVGLDGINLTTRIRIRHGLLYGSADRELLPMGIYRVTEPVRQGATVQIRAASFEDYLVRARFERERVLPRADVRTMLHALIRPVLPSAQLAFRDINPETVIRPITATRDRWPLIDGDAEAPSVARSLGARVYHGASGEWVIEPQPALSDPVTFEAKLGETITESPEIPQSLEGLYTSVVVTGESTDDEAPTVGPVVVWDGDWRSPTYRWRSADDGGIGPLPRFYSSPVITSVGGAYSAGASILARSLGWVQQLSFNQLHDPSIEAGDVGMIETDNGMQKQIIDSITYDLTGAPMQAQTRAVRAALDGSIETDYGEPEEGTLE